MKHKLYMKTISLLPGLLAVISTLHAKATVIEYAFTTRYGIRYPAAYFYGYRSSTDGAGDNAFKDCLAAFDEIKNDSSQQNAPLIVIWGKDGCATCDAYAKMVNTYFRGFGGALSSKKFINGYFRGNTQGTGPTACNEAHAFIVDKCGGNPASCHIMGLYGEFEDGSVMSSSQVVSTDYSGFFQQLNEFRKAYDNAYAKHRYTPPKASAAFGVGDEELQAVAEVTKQIYVPFVRTNNVEIVETNWLEVTYPDGMVTTNELLWTKGMEYGEVNVPVIGRLTNIVDKVTLVLLNTNHLAVATNSIKCAAKPANSATFPYPPYTIDEPVVGGWTVDASFIESSRDDVAGKRAAVAAKLADYDAATNALAEATAEYDSATNLVAKALAASNTTYVAYSGKLDAYNLAAGAYDIATNALAAALAVSNSTHVAYTNSCAALVASVLAYDAATNSLAAALATSNATYTTYTNAQAVAEALISTYDSATNAVAAAEAQYGVESEQYTSATNTAAIAKSAMDNAVYLRDFREGEYTTAAADVDVKQTAASDALSAIGTAEGNRDTAKSAYDKAVSDVADKQTKAANMASALETATTECNTAKKDYDDAVSFLEGRQSVAEEKTAALEQAAADRDSAAGALETAESDLASAEEGFFLVVNGGIVWDDALIALNDDVLAKPEFTTWCTNNQVSLVYLDKAEPGTGASLFSYNVASNGNSGATFMSINGLSATEGAAYAAQALDAANALGMADARHARSYQIALVRADGSVCGRLRPQRNMDGTCDLYENIARLDELVAQFDEEEESSNDTPEGASGIQSAIMSFGDQASGKLTINDTADCFKLTGDGWSNGKVVFGVSSTNIIHKSANPKVVILRYDDASGECSAIKGDESIFATDGERVTEIVYSLPKADIEAGMIFAAVSAYADAEAEIFGSESEFDYSLAAYPATPNAGIASFDEQPEDAIGQASTNQVVHVPLRRLCGSDGDLSITITLDEERTTATNRYEFVDQTLVWTNGETGVKYVDVTLIGSDYNDGLREIVLNIDAIKALADIQKSTYSILYGTEPTEEGQISVISATPAACDDGRIYVRCGQDGTLRAGDEVSIAVNRTGGKGPAAAYISWKNGKEQMRETLIWGDYMTGTQTAILNEGFPIPGKAGYTDVTITITSSNNVPVVKDGAAVKLRVVPYDAPLFDDESVTWSGVQYTTTATNLTSIAFADGVTVKSLKKISGSLPAGLKISLEDGKLTVTGTSTAGTVSTKALYWVLATGKTGETLYSMPVTIAFENKALAEVNDGFTKARSWTGLPLIDKDRIVGLLDLSVAKNGKTSVRCRIAGGKTISLASPGLAEVFAGGDVRLFAEKSIKSSGVTSIYVFDAILGANGSLNAFVTCDGECIAAAKLDAETKSWSADNTAERYRGNYVAAYAIGANTNENTRCFGAPVMRLKFDSTNAWHRGVVTYAGTLPNGRTISGTSYLLPAMPTAESGSLPVFATSSADTFSSMIDIGCSGVAATEGLSTYWSHNESGITELSYENDYNVVGALWSRDLWAGIPGITCNLNRNSGIASGTQRMHTTSEKHLSTVTWRGVAIPGDEPRIIGAYWYNASVGYVDAKNTPRKRTVRCGNGVLFKEETGE